MVELSFFKEFNDKKIYSLSGEKIPQNSFIVTAKSFKEVLYEPYLAGKELQEKMKKVGVDFVDVITEIVLKEKKQKRKEIVELIFMSGGLFYGISEGFKELHNFAPNQCYIGIQRKKRKGTEGTFYAVSSYQNFEALTDNATVIIGDTIATGATMSKGLSLLFEKIKETKIRLNTLIICTLAGCLKGLNRINEIINKERKVHSFDFYFFAAQQLFTLMPDGTDLRFLEKDSIMPEETKEYTLSKYGPYLGKNMKCAVFDWGTRCKHEEAHYLEFLHYVNEELKKDIPEEAKTKLLDMKSKTEIRLNELYKTIA